jgi:hypothetical protein
MEKLTQLLSRLTIWCSEKFSESSPCRKWLHQRGLCLQLWCVDQDIKKVGLGGGKSFGLRLKSSGASCNPHGRFCERKSHKTVIYFRSPLGSGEKEALYQVYVKMIMSFCTIVQMSRLLITSTFLSSFFDTLESYYRSTNSIKRISSSFDEHLSLLPIGKMCRKEKKSSKTCSFGTEQKVPIAKFPSSLTGIIMNKLSQCN